MDCVDAWNGDKLFVFALLYYLAVVDNKYLIGMTYRLEPVSDHDDGLVARQSLDGLLQPVLIFRVYVGRCLVKNDYRSVFEHCAGDGYALPFTAGERCAAPRRLQCHNRFQGR